jgi:hypothetical protein
MCKIVPIVPTLHPLKCCDVTNVLTWELNRYRQTTDDDDNDDDDDDDDDTL